MRRRTEPAGRVDHDRWMVSFADMMTLLFALFVVLFALGQADLDKIRELKASVRWAFHIEGEGMTKDEGFFDKQTGGGEVAVAAPLMTAQDGTMREFLAEQLAQYREVAGKSLTIVQTDDTVAFTAPIADFFPSQKPWPVRDEVKSWLEQTLVTSLTFASNIQILVRTPDVPIGRDADGRILTSTDLCVERLKTMERFVRKLPEVRGGMVECRWSRLDEQPGREAWRWEEESTISIAFTNARAGR